MAKEKRIFLITAVILTVLYITSAVFTLGQFFPPSSYWSVLNESEDKNTSLASASALIDLTLEKKFTNEKGETATKTVGVKEIYVYVGATHSATAQGNEDYLTIKFQFKSKSLNEVDFTKREEKGIIPVIYATGGYKWLKVFDATTVKDGEIKLERVKICSPDSLDLYEVVFIDSDGDQIVVKPAQTTATDAQYDAAKMITDEPDSFILGDSKKYNLTDDELKSLASVNSLKKGILQVGVSPLDTVLDTVAVWLFKTPFAVRAFDCLAGLGIILLVYAFIFKLFGSIRSSVLGVIFALALGSVFTASNFSFGLVGAFFAFLSLYFATDFFINHYYLQEKKSAITSLALIGIFYGLAVTANMAYSLTVLGLVALIIFASRRGYKQYKKDDREAEGLGKEEVFLAYRKKKIILGVGSLLALLVIPTVLFIGSYSIVVRVYKGYYGLGYFASAWALFKDCLTPAYQSNPLALLVGFGGVKMGEFYSFTNVFVCILALVCFIFVTVATFFGNKIKFFKKVKRSINKYKIITACFISSLLPVIFGLTSSPWGFALTSVFYISYIVFAESILHSCLKKKAVKAVVNVCLIVSVVIFAMGYVGYVGISLPEIAQKILYLWQVI